MFCGFIRATAEHLLAAYGRGGIKGLRFSGDRLIVNRLRVNLAERACVKKKTASTNQSRNGTERTFKST